MQHPGALTPRFDMALASEGRYSRSERSPRAFTAARLVLSILLLWAPLPFGSVYAWAWAAISLFALVILVLWAVGCIQTGRVRIGYSRLLIPAALLLLLGLIQIVF